MLAPASDLSVQQLCGEMGDDSPIVFVSCCEVQEVAFFPNRCGEEVTALRAVERVHPIGCAKLLFLSCKFVSLLD